VFIKILNHEMILPFNSKLQEGIYYFRGDYPRSSYSVVFLRARPPFDSLKIRQTFINLWQVHTNLKKILVSDLNLRGKDAYHRTLTVLYGYGPKFFEIGIPKKKPRYLNDEWLFLTPTLGGSPVLPESGLRYADEVTTNDVANDHIIIQFIGETQLATHRAVVETWKFIRKTEVDESMAPMVMRTFYTGFNRPDGRSWLGFHDGVSNVRPYDRLRIISTDGGSLNRDDYWTGGGGTYLAFLRIGINLGVWEGIPVKEQERIVGRQKSTGCPLIGIGRDGKNIFAPGCPVPGTRQITEVGNERFREYGITLARNSRTDPHYSKVENSHVRRMLRAREQIFRQGFEYLESIDSYPYLRTGLNFVSFQGGTDKIYKAIKYGFQRVNFGGDSAEPIPGADRLLSVYAAGFFLVPPFHKGDLFPGDIIFKSTGQAGHGLRSHD
jgi:deferrochelatase/peroxidase EfeB